MTAYPSSRGAKALIDALVVQLRPEQFFQRVKAMKIPEEIEYGFLAVVLH